MRDKNEMVLPLQGIRVLDLTRLIPGAFCTCMLGDAGAEVIKIEEPNTGDYEREIHPFIGSMASRFLILNRNKKSVALNLKDKEGRDIFLKMVESSDVLAEGFRPGTMKRLGIDYEALHSINPRLIYCSISSFGHDGPYRDAVAHDINILGMSGFFDITGMRQGPPVIPGVQIADSVAGMNAALSILIALIHREKTGKGQFLDISMFDGMLSWLFDAAKYVFAEESVPRRGEGRLWGGFPNYNTYETRDGKYITVGSLETKFKKTLLEKLGMEDLAAQEDGITSSRLKNSDQALHDSFQDIFLTRTRDEWMEELEGLNICVGPVNTLEEALSHPQAISRKMVVDVDHPSVGAIRQIGSALKLSDVPIDPNRNPAPLLGQHTREVLARLGYDEEQIDDFVSREEQKGSHYE